MLFYDPRGIAVDMFLSRRNVRYLCCNLSVRRHDPHQLVRRKGPCHGSGELRGVSSLSVETGLVACWLNSAEEVLCGAALRIPQASRTSCPKVLFRYAHTISTSWLTFCVANTRNATKGTE